MFRFHFWNEGLVDILTALKAELSMWPVSSSLPFPLISPLTVSPFSHKFPKTSLSLTAEECGEYVRRRKTSLLGRICVTGALDCWPALPAEQTNTNSQSCKYTNKCKYWRYYIALNPNTNIHCKYRAINANMQIQLFRYKLFRNANNSMYHWSTL